MVHRRKTRIQAWNDKVNEWWKNLNFCVNCYNIIWLFHMTLLRSVAQHFLTERVLVQSSQTLLFCWTLSKDFRKLVYCLCHSVLPTSMTGKFIFYNNHCKNKHKSLLKKAKHNPLNILDMYKHEVYKDSQWCLTKQPFH